MSPLYMWETRGTEPTPLPWACVASNWEVGFGHSGLDPHATLWSDMRCGKSRVGSLCRDSLGSFPLLSEERVLCDIQEKSSRQKVSGCLGKEGSMNTWDTVGDVCGRETVLYNTIIVDTCHYTFAKIHRLHSTNCGL